MLLLADVVGTINCRLAEIGDNLVCRGLALCRGRERPDSPQGQSWKTFNKVRSSSGSWSWSGSFEFVRVMVRSLFRAGVGVFQSYGQGHAWPGPWSDLYPAYDHGHGLD